MRAVMVGLFATGSLVAGGCVGQTGGQTVVFSVAAAGPTDATAGQPLAFTSGGFDVALTHATLHIGAVYLDQAAPVSGSQATDCYLTGTYVGQETSALDVDLLNPTPQPFPAMALGITQPPALVEQAWLTGGDINTVADATPILVIAGTATQGAATFPFTGTVTIGANHASAGGTGGGNSICKQRIISPIQDPLTIEMTGGLLLRIDPRPFFVDVDFSELPANASTGGYAFSDDPSVPAYAPTGQNLYSNLRSTAPYSFSWTGAL
jgi:hypothetical protein